MKRLHLLVPIFVLLSFHLLAAPFHGEIRKFKQPDGSFVAVKLYGTEYYMRGEGLDEYTVIRDKATQWICYAALSSDGKELVSTGIVYHGTEDNPGSLRSDLNFTKHLDINAEERNKLITATKKFLDGDTKNGKRNESIAKTTPIHTVTGDIKGLCIVVDFSDEAGTVPISEYEDFCNDMNYTGYGNNGSLRRFYSDISGGLVDYQNIVYGYYRAPLTFAEYDAMPYAEGAQEILGLALNWIDSLGFDFSTLSLNPNNTIMAINLMFTGNPPNWAQGMWFHQGYYGNFEADGVYSGSYNCSPAEEPLTLSTVAHENGHMIGKWPDTYKYDADNGFDGIGYFDLMCWAGYEHNPVPPNPLFRSNVGWGEVIDVTNYNGLNYDTANSGTCYIYKNLNDTNEFFLLENRIQTGRSQAIESEGLTIWHIDRLGDNQSMHHEAMLVHADNQYSDQNGVCFYNTFSDEYSSNTTPNSNWYNGDPSGLRVWDIGGIQNTMNYKLGLGQSGPSLNLTYVNMTNDNNTNGYLEAAESANLNVVALNFGQISSATATITCEATGNTAGYVLVNTPTVNAGIIDVSESQAAAFNITIDPQTPIGTVITLKFLISDGESSIYITRSFTIGNVILMNNNQSATTCESLFRDGGDVENNYSSNTYFVKTFMPSTPGEKIHVSFSNFSLEYDTQCYYDYMTIYDGPSTSSIPIGTFCGTNSPGTLVSTHTTGALTFEFQSDAGYNEAGWEALIFCNDASVEMQNSDNAYEIFPNPSAGIFNIVMHANETSELIVTDMAGRVILKRETNGNNQTSLDLSGKTNGIYILQIMSNGKVSTERLVLGVN